MSSKEERKALDKLEKELRESDLWGKMKAVYPIVGRSYPGKRIFNLKDIPRYRRKQKIRSIFNC